VGTLGRLTADQLDLTPGTYDFEQTITDTLGNLGTPDDGFDSYLADTITLLSTVGTPGDSLLDDLNLAAGIGGSIDPLSLQGDATSLPDSLAEGDAILSDVGALNGSAGVPAPPPPSGGSGGVESDCTKRGAQYGYSKQGTFPGVQCDIVPVFAVLRVQDGPCTYKAFIAGGFGASFPAKIVSFTLLTGDASVWRLRFHTEGPSDGTQIDYYDVTIAPKLLPALRRDVRSELRNPGPPKPTPSQIPSHFDATGRLVTSSPSKTYTVCMSVDCIP
jgi:hypothetical protein